jgi:nucleoside-diphosphate-sugar epimerase
MDKDSLKGIADGVDIVFHLAAIGDINAMSRKAYLQYRSVNVKGTRNLLEECAGKKVRKFVHFSSTAAMGRPKAAGTMNEMDRCRPSTPYEVSKRESELVVMDAWKRRRLPTVILRPVMVRGGRENKESKKLQTSVRMILVPIIGDGENRIYSVHVDDVLAAAIAASKRGRPGQTYIIGGSRETWNESVDRIATQLRKRIFKLHIPLFVARPAVAFAEAAFQTIGLTPIFTMERLERLSSRAEYDCSKARDELGFEANEG